jgi:uncharacterized membrane protein
MADHSKSPVWRLVYAVALANLLSVMLYLLRVAGTGSWRYWYMTWNLFLGWLPLLFAWGLVRHLQKKRWLDPQGIALTVLWLLFLPNSFYLVSDLIHLETTGEINILFDAVMFFSFIVNGYIAGMWSVYIVQRQLKRRLDEATTVALVTGVFLLCGFAIYLGRTLRWNTWDVFVNPAGVLFDASEGIINPLSHPQVLVTTGSFFLLISSIYWVVYQFIQSIRLLAPQKAVPKRRAK